MSRDYLITADTLGLHVILFKSCCWASGIRDMARWSPPIGFNAAITPMVWKSLHPDGMLVEQSLFCVRQQKDGIFRI